MPPASAADPSHAAHSALQNMRFVVVSWALHKQGKPQHGKHGTGRWQLCSQVLLSHPDEC